jgi:hypothetical protein
MITFPSARTLGLLMALPGLAPAATVTSLTPVGQDGGKTLYRVRCSDQRPATVVVEPARRQVCIYADRLGRSCRPDWTVENAAAYACRATPSESP